ncbi:MAG: gfo/Idh/MocA family oxidoreductase [Chitinophagaceae bacterium]|nr:MAG: gfo/Idh/MocA family oxidoreductase [Chitinophagaceae bacterium]
MLKTGLFGVGHLGKIHLKILKELKGFDLVGIYDADKKVAEKVSKEFNVPAFSDEQSLFDAVDALDIVTPTPAHYDLALKGLKGGKHVFVEKPLAHNLEQAHELMELSEESPVIAQVGHVERFNPAFKMVEPLAMNPMFIESHRLAPFNPRGTEVSVVMDLMIHDIDLLLTVVKSNVKSINASGVAVVSNTVDIANARIEFDDGAVANLTASRISLKKMRKIRLFRNSAYLSVDLLEKEAEIFLSTGDKSLKDKVDAMEGVKNSFTIGEGMNKKDVTFIKPKIVNNNAIAEELTEFRNSIVEGQEVVVSFSDGYKAMYIADQIQRKIEKKI